MPRERRITDAEPSDEAIGSGHGANERSSSRRPGNIATRSQVFGNEATGERVVPEERFR